MSNRLRASASRRLKLIAEVSQAVFDATESFRVRNIGSDLAYLLMAVANNDKLDVWPDVPSRLIGILREELPAGHAIWRHIRKRHAP